MSLYIIFGPPLLKLYFYDPINSLKITCLLLYAALKLKPMCTRKLLHVSLHTSRNVHKNKNFCSFPQWVLNNLTLVLPYAWKRSDSTLHCLLEGYILSLLDALKEENFGEKGNYISLLPHLLMLDFASLCPFQHTLLLFPIFPLISKLSIEMEDWSGGGPGGGINFSISTRCR